MNADVEKAVEASMSPRVDALIERVMQKHPGFSASAQARYYEAVHQELAPLARDLEAEIARLTQESAQRFIRGREWAELSGRQEARAEKAEALLRDIKAWDIDNWKDRGRKGFFSLPLELRARITAHLGAEHE